MFKIGEFSTIARVTTVQLRYYDEIGLFKPAHINPENDYRYYLIEQLPLLNRILALKDLGLSLDQIAQLIHDNVTNDEIYGMFKLREAQIEQAIEEEYTRLQRVRARLKQIRQEGTLSEHDVVLKAIPAQHYLSIRECARVMSNMRPLFYAITDAIQQHSVLGVTHCMALFHGQAFVDQNIDWELGFLLKETSTARIPLDDKRWLSVQELPPVSEMATVVHAGPWREMFMGYAALGAWIDVNGFQIDGESREVYLNLVPPDHDDDFVVEIQIPVSKQVKDKQ